MICCGSGNKAVGFVRKEVIANLEYLWCKRRPKIKCLILQEKFMVFQQQNSQETNWCGNSCYKLTELTGMCGICSDSVFKSELCIILIKNSFKNP